jgi:hypothetical protein
MIIQTKRILTIFGGLALSWAAHAATFEDNGTVENITVGTNEVRIDGKTYLLPNSVVESNSPGTGPAILQLKEGMFVVFSGRTGQMDTIDSLAIHLRQPTDTTEHGPETP